MTDPNLPHPASADNVTDPADPDTRRLTDPAPSPGQPPRDDSYEPAQDVEYIDPDTDQTPPQTPHSSPQAPDSTPPQATSDTTQVAAYTPLHAAIEIHSVSHRYAKPKSKLKPKLKPKSKSKPKRRTKRPPTSPSDATPESEFDPTSPSKTPSETPNENYDPLLALNDLSLRIDPGEIFGILGPNGSGKTTLIRIIATLLKPTEGGIKIFGNDALDDPQAVRSKLGVVFQTPSLDLRLTARENLKHHGELYGLNLRRKKRRQRIDALLDAVGLLDRAKEPVAQFSGGMRRRVEIAKALLPGPTLLVMDEPATGLDPTARTELQTIIEDLRARFAVTVVFSTHLLGAAERCDRVAILDRGSLVAVDRPDALVADLTGETATAPPGPHTTHTPHGPRVHIADIILNNTTQQTELINRLEAILPHARVTPIAEAVRCENVDPVALTTALGQWHDLDIRRLTLGRPTLADVFTHLTGRPLT